MLKDAYDQGYAAALEKFAVEGPVRSSALDQRAPGSHGTSNPEKRFGRGLVSGQKRHLSNLGKSVGRILDPSTGPMSRKNLKGLAWSSAKGLAPSMAIGAAGLWGAKKLLGGSKKQQPTQQFG